MSIPNYLAPRFLSHVYCQFSNQGVTKLCLQCIASQFGGRLFFGNALSYTVNILTHRPCHLIHFGCAPRFISRLNQSVCVSHAAPPCEDTRGRQPLMMSPAVRGRSALCGVQWAHCTTCSNAWKWYLRDASDTTPLWLCASRYVEQLDVAFDGCSLPQPLLSFVFTELVWSHNVILCRIEVNRKSGLH